MNIFLKESLKKNYLNDSKDTFVLYFSDEHKIH